eukprot:10261255-Ditylum_brightwellii.AAC.1
MINDLINIITEEVLGGITPNPGTYTSSNGNSRQRALRARHLPQTRYTRPRSLRRLQKQEQRKADVGRRRLDSSGTFID